MKNKKTRVLLPFIILIATTKNRQAPPFQKE